LPELRKEVAEIEKRLGRKPDNLENG